VAEFELGSGDVLVSMQERPEFGAVVPVRWGFVIVPTLVLGLGFSMLELVGTSMVVIAINSLVSLAVRLGDGGIDWAVIAPFALSGITGCSPAVGRPPRRTRPAAVVRPPHAGDRGLHRGQRHHRPPMSSGLAGPLTLARARCRVAMRKHVRSGGDADDVVGR
jgi:Sulfite exporter TauE/SafE